MTAAEKRPDARPREVIRTVRFLLRTWRVSDRYGTRAHLERTHDEPALVRALQVRSDIGHYLL